MAGHFGNILTIEGNAAVPGRDQTDNALHGCGFSGAVSADQSHDLAFPNLKADALQRLDHAIIYLQILDFQ